MSVCFPKSEKFIDAVNRACSFSKSWSSEYHDHGCYYDAGLCSKHDYVFEISVSDSWTSEDTNEMKRTIRKVCGGPVYGKLIKNRFNVRWIELHFNCSPKVLDSLEADNPEYKLWKKVQVESNRLPEGMKAPVFTAEEIEIIDNLHDAWYYKSLPEKQKVVYREIADKYSKNLALKKALRPCYKPVKYGKLDCERAKSLAIQTPEDQKKLAEQMASRIKDMAKLERRYSACYEICGSSSRATEVFSQALYFRNSTMERL